MGDERSLEDRLSALEAEVASLRAALGQPTRPPEPAAPPHVPAEKPARGIDRPFEDKSWLNKLGIALLLFGVAFLFKFSIDQGWLTPWVRVGFGFVLAAGLFAGAERLPEARRALGRVLTGGAIATLYITIFAAFQLYALLPHAAAFALMVSTTLASFALAIRQDEAVHSVIGAAGGFATPFLLHTDSANLPGLVFYASIVTAGATAVFVRKGWRALHWTSAAGMLGVLAIAIDAQPEGGDRAATQAGIVVAALSGWVVPVVRALASLGDPDRWPPTTLGFASSERLTGHAWPHPHMMVFTMAGASLFFSAVLWRFDETESGWLAAGLAVVWLAAAWLLSTRGDRSGLVLTHGLAAGILATFATAQLLEGDARLCALAAEAAAFHGVAQRLNASGPALVGHAMFFWLGLLMMDRFAGGIPERGLFTAEPLSELFVLAAAGVAALRMTDLRSAYLVAVHVGVLTWLLRELGDLPNGQAVVTASWVVYSVALLLVGLQRDGAGLRKAALATFLAIVAKLFLVDLDEVDPIWRILSFLGFGSILLGLSYFFPTLRGDDPD